MRLLRWAVELATEPDGQRARAGVATLKALKDAHVMIRADRAFVHAVSTAVMAAASTATAYSALDEFRTNKTEGDPGA